MRRYTGRGTVRRIEGKEGGCMKRVGKKRGVREQEEESKGGKEENSPTISFSKCIVL